MILRIKYSTCPCASHRLEGCDIEPEELALLEVGELSFVEHPAHVRWSVTGHPVAGRCLVDMGVIDVFGVRVVPGALLDQPNHTGLSQ